MKFHPHRVIQSYSRHMCHLHTVRVLYIHDVALYIYVIHTREMYVIYTRHVYVILLEANMMTYIISGSFAFSAKEPCN